VGSPLARFVYKMASWERVGQRGDAPVRIDLDVPGFFLLVFCHVDFVNLVGELEFLQVLWRL
jgi:hypothetical protein